MDEEQQQDPKISIVEVILIGLVFALFDLIEIVLLLFALDDFWIIDIITSVIFFYLLIKRVPPMRQFTCWLIELIPWVGALPLLTIGWGLTVWADRHPAGVVAKAGALAGTAQGKGALAKGGAKTKGVGAQSMARVERAEGRATELKERVDKRLETRPSAQLSGRRNVDGVGAGNEEGVPTEETAEAESRGQVSTASRRELGERPTPFEELDELTEETPQQPSEEEEEQGLSA
ncbi:MAG: hypothetical protein A3B25_03940 [Candidatus Ryanbacteria bacterium RIFCSPLOWO2_01_FULL_48_26]|uniref:Uncharacterized protein n=1 Tax=Candidatus Ryanbacteria bacterium RIFCSPLOWO2_01_FULL_48_26 TaxID=1802126 RepID=A0A1G2GRK7_9BACT|nr:MAG: hypothetical protein A3B25_03940 [Candidatus Ryanbacteria bacterium RIFCSPLOWO2_01_FULL_48_26]